MIDGSLHTVGFAPLTGPDLRMVLATGLPKTATLAPTNYHLTLNLLGFLGAAIAAVMLAWLAADRSLLRPIRHLVAASASIGAGNLAARIGQLPGAVEELQSLGASFDAMAAKLRARDESIAAMAEKIVMSEEHHRLLANNASDMIAPGSTRTSPEPTSLPPAATWLDMTRTNSSDRPCPTSSSPRTEPASRLNSSAPF